MFTTMLVVLVLLVIPLQVMLERQAPNFFGGEKAEIGQLPYVVAIRLKLDPDETECLFQDKEDKAELACAGTILSPKWVLSVADCVDSEDKHNDLELIVGQTNLGNPNFEQQCTPVNRVVMHRNYIDTLPSTDDEIVENLALYRGKRALLFYDIVRQVVVPDKRLYPDTFSGEAYAAGWGNNPLRPDNLVPSQLQYAKTRTTDLDECKEYYNSDDNDIKAINERSLCFKFEIPDVVFSRYNKGAPIIDNGELVGIVSVAGSEHENSQLAAVVDTAYHLKFIKKYVKDIYVYHTGKC